MGAWWQLQSNAAPIGPVTSSSLDLTLIGSDAGVVALVAEMPTNSGGPKVREADPARMQSTLRATSAWTAILCEGTSEASRQLLRLHRPEGVQPGGVWLVGVLVRSKDASGGWQAEAIDEIYPATRLEKVLPLRCKDF